MHLNMCGQRMSDLIPLLCLSRLRFDLWFLRHNINHPLADVDLFLYPADLGADRLTPYFVLKT